MDISELEKKVQLMFELPMYFSEL